MQRPPLFAAALLIGALLPCASLADPPAHAPAHGYRAKHKHRDHGHHGGTFHSGVEVVFDSERGVHIAVGFPGLFFDAGHFYRHTEHGWQVSARADGGWHAADSVPARVMKARGPGPAKRRKKH
jgi:hypothetical protein